MKLPFALLPFALLTMLVRVDCTMTSPYIAQCTQCCYAEPDEFDKRLARQIAPLLARQCPDCRLLSAARCTELEQGYGSNIQSLLVHYKLILPGGSTAEHCAHIFRSQLNDWRWNGLLYPPDSLLKPDCIATR